MMTHNLKVSVVTTIFICLVQSRIALPQAELCTSVPKSAATCSCSSGQMSLKDSRVPSVYQQGTAVLLPAAFDHSQMIVPAGVSVIAANNEDEFPWELFIPAIKNRFVPEITKPRPDPCPGWTRRNKMYVYYFDEVIRLGDDINYHPENLCIPTAERITYTATFYLPVTCNRYTSAKIQYWITASSQENRFLINGQLAGTTCSTGNSTEVCGTGNAIPIAAFLHPGRNTLNIELVKYPGDDYRPFDDIEIYKLRVQLSERRISPFR